MCCGEEGAITTLGGGARARGGGAHHDLPLHSDAEQDDEVEHENGPEDRNVEDGEQGEDEGHHDRPRGRVPTARRRQLMITARSTTQHVSPVATELTRT